MDVELIPLQAPEIEAAVVSALAAESCPAPDPWWQAGLEDALGT